MYTANFYNIMSVVLFLIFNSYSCVNQINSLFDTELIQTQAITTKNENVLNGMWKQYKKIDVITGDTTCLENCYLEIKNYVIKYEVSGEIEYSDTLVHDTLLRYTFRNRHYDVLNCYLRKDTIIVLSRYDLEGNEEFFRKIPRH